MMKSQNSCCWALLLSLGMTAVVDCIRILPSSRRMLEHLVYSNISSSHDQLHRKLVTVNVPDTPDGHLVQNLPLLDPATFTTQHWAGHLPASSTVGDKYFFYWLFAPDLSNSDITDPLDPKIPLVIWLNGGPACSSMDGLFIENGPFRIVIDETTGDYKLVPDAYSWHRLPAYTMYIDQPVGTGLSFTTSHTYPTNDQEVNVDFYYFLQEFFKLHSDKFVNENNVMNRDLFFSGESYAGHYIPSLINYLLKRNNDIQVKKIADKIQIPPKGAAIGNGWTHPFYQYAGADFAYGHGIIDLQQVAAFKEKEKQCQELLNQEKYYSPICFDLIDDIVHESLGGTSDYKVVSYDVRKSALKHKDRIFPPGHKVIESYLGGWPVKPDFGDFGNMPTDVHVDVLKAINAEASVEAKQKYQECTDPPYHALSHLDGKGVIDDVVEILEFSDYDVQLLFFNGVHDIVCNHNGNEVFLANMPWKDAENWKAAKRYAWFAPDEEDGKISGYMKEYNNLKFLKVMDAGHMVPLDVPNVSFQMMKNLVESKTFDTSLQSLDSAEDKNDCPVCPACEERESTSEASENRKQDSSMAGFIISYAWLVASVGFLSFLAIVMYFRRRQQRFQHARQLAAIPSYDVELREASYRDTPTGDDDFEETEEKVVI